MEDYINTRRKILAEQKRLGKANNNVPSMREADARSEEFEAFVAELANAKDSGKDDLKGKTVAELKEMAKELGVEGYSTMRKDELLETLSSE